MIDITEAARAVGCTGYSYWEIDPEYFAKTLMTAAKRYARFLKNSGLVKSHNEALETVAKAAGFAHWHAFHSVIQGLIDAFNTEIHCPRPKDGREPIKTLIAAFVFMVQAPPECALSIDEQNGLRKAAEQLARACGSPIEPMLDMIGRMNGADNWALLLARRPEQTTSPLYRFEVDEFDNGSFAISSACCALIEQQDNLFQKYHSRSLSQQREFEDQLACVLEAQPDFLEGLLAKAEILRYKPEFRSQRGEILTEAIRKADALLPKDFKGVISWHSILNGFYHRLLYQAMIWHAHNGQTASAITLNHRQLSISKGDNLAVRKWLPVLLVADGQSVAAEEACKKMASGAGHTDSSIELVNAICHFANGRLQQSAEALYLSVFMYPPMRHVFCLDMEALGLAVDDPQNRRLGFHDTKTMVEQYGTAAMQVDGLTQTFKQWLERPIVSLTETVLAREFHANWQQPKGSVKRWQADASKAASFLSKSLT